MKAHRYDKDAFLSSNAQDFIEELLDQLRTSNQRIFLSSNAQDFIEEFHDAYRRTTTGQIPEQ